MHTVGNISHLLEPLLLLVMVYAFWHPIEERYRWLPLLIVVPVFMLVRLILHGRLFTRFPLDILFIAFLLLGLLNLYLSPYTAAHPMSRLYQLGRPALGMALCVYFVEYVRQYKHLDGLLTATLLLTGLIGVVALFASDWTSKSDQLIFIINALPPFSAPQALFGKFNVNEIAGSLVWLVPLSAGLCAWRGDRLLDRILRWGFVGVFVITSTALLLGQSRFALAGALFTLALMVPLLIKGRRGRLTAWIAILVFIILEIMIVRNVFTSPGQVTLAGRDESSMAGRLDVWSSAFDIIRANPLTGVGMNLFRDAAVRRDFPAPLFDQPVLPHAHNEYLQIATDLGLPGFVLFIAIYAVAFQMLYRTYRAGSPKQKALAVAAAGGLVAHALFGFGDAVTLWDRFAFVWWWLLALGSASYYMAVNKTNPYFHNGS